MDVISEKTAFPTTFHCSTVSLSRVLVGNFTEKRNT